MRGTRKTRGAAGITDDLVLRASSGDARAYNELFRRLEARLLAYIRIRMGRRLAAAVEPGDVLQETFLRAHLAFPRFEARGLDGFRRWIYRLADNRIRDLADYVGAKKRTPEGQLQRGSEVIDSLKAARRSPPSSADARDAEERLMEVFDTLAADYHEALILRYFHGLTFQEIAAELGTSETSSRRLVAHGTARLGAALRSG